VVQGLEAATGKQVIVNAAVNPELIGGVVARVGSTVYDGSVRSRLESLGRRLAGE
jgi:F-type H+-transporting ATPase subunit delta